MTPEISDLGAVPSDWRAGYLVDLVDAIRSGTTAEQNVEGRGLPVTRIETISKGQIDRTRVRYVDLPAASLEPYRLRAGDILLSHINSVSHVGKVARYDGGEPLYHGMNLMLLRPDPAKVDALFVFLVLASPQAKAYFESRCKKAVSQASLNRGDVGALCLPLPSIKEQKSIAAILSSVDEAIEATQAVIEQLGVVKKAMMAELFTRGLPGRHTKFRQTEIGEVPEDWEVLQLGAVTRSITVGHVGPTSDGYAGGEVLFLRTGNLKDGQLTLKDVKKITRSFHESLAKSQLRPGDVLVARVGNPGGAALVPSDFPESNCANIIVIRAGETLQPSFLRHYLNGPAASRQSAGFSAGSAQAVLNIGALRKLLIVCPSVAEQQAISESIGAIEDRISVERNRSRPVGRCQVAAGMSEGTGVC